MLVHEALRQTEMPSLRHPNYNTTMTMMTIPSYM